MIEVVGYRPQHLAQIQIRKEDGYKPKEVGGMAVTCLFMDKPIAILGGFPLGPTCYHVWGIVSSDIQKNPVSFHKETLKLLNTMQDKFKLRRIQLDVRCSFLRGQHWAKSLGFKPEGIMRKFAADGEDCILYSRVTE